jgi:hypothetical protein
LIPKHLKTEELKEYWPHIKMGLGELLIKDPEQNWIPEDVYYQIKSGQSHCVLGLTDGVIDGFFVGQVLKDGSFFAWVGYCQRDVDSGLKILDSFAKQLNCKKIKFATGRSGWARLAKRHGYKPTIWVKEL